MVVGDKYRDRHVHTHTPTVILHISSTFYSSCAQSRLYRQTPVPLKGIISLELVPETTNTTSTTIPSIPPTLFYSAMQPATCNRKRKRFRPLSSNRSTGPTLGRVFDTLAMRKNKIALEKYVLVNSALSVYVIYRKVT